MAVGSAATAAAAFFRSTLASVEFSTAESEFLLPVTKSFRLPVRELSLLRLDRPRENHDEDGGLLFSGLAMARWV